ncbi:MAG: sigma-70 family RNA polymerase sigma factor [Sedimentisphaerales bacterium]|nr:sigma-70 family RNA polymerase sigma factor [Sedimentisphaerales bacterium]
MQTDTELVKAALDGQKEAFAELVRRYERPVRAVAINILSGHHSVQDAVQDAFVAGYQNLSMLRNRDSFGPWLMKIARRCALDWMNRRPKGNPLETNPAAVIENPNGQLDEDSELLLAAVVELPEVERQVVMLRYFAGHNIREVADAVGRSVGTVTKQLSRAHKRLRKILKESEL